MRRQIIAIIGLVSLVSGIVACTVAFEDPPTGPDLYKCETNDDCLGPNQICKENNEGTKVCKEEGGPTECVDKDGDGYGTGENTSTCEKCASNDCTAEYCCKQDCNDDNPDINPGEIDRCDGTDNNCNPMDDDVPGKGCSSNSDCTGLAPLMQSGVDYKCETVNGVSQCVIKGDFTLQEQCRKPSGWGLCNSGAWGSVPAECTMN